MGFIAEQGVIIIMFSRLSFQVTPFRFNLSIPHGFMDG